MSLFIATVAAVVVTLAAIAFDYSTLSIVGGIACFALAAMLFFQEPS